MSNLITCLRSPRFDIQYTLFANASIHGSPPIRALFFEFPDEPELFAVDRQYLIGRDLLVTPVLTPNVSTVAGQSYRATFSSWLKLQSDLDFRYLPRTRPRDLARLVHP